MADPAILWPYKFETQPVLRVTCNAVTEDLTIATGSDPLTIPEILALLDTALETHTEGPTTTVTLTSGFVVQITSDIALTLLWSHANTTLDPAVLGWTASDTASATTLTAPNQTGGLWRPGKPAEEDSGDRQRVIGGVATALSGKQRTSFFAQPYEERDLMFGLLLPAVAEARFAESTEPKGALETAWVESLSYGYPFRYAEDETALGTYTTYVLRTPQARPTSRDDRFPAQRWRADLRVRKTA